MNALPPYSVVSAISFVAEHGVVLASAKGQAPRLIDAIAGEVILGHWWSHSRANAIYNVLTEVQDSPEVLVCRLLKGKITLVHRRLWAALARLADRFEPGQIARVVEEHTETGRHATAETPFPNWVPAGLLEAASALSEADALALIGHYIPASRSVRGRWRPGTAPNMADPARASPNARQTDDLADRIEIVDADPSWPTQFEMEARILREALTKFSSVRIEHFGSTAVPNLGAKPIIDIMVICPDQNMWPALVNVLVALGYVYWAENPRKDRMFFVKGLPPQSSRRTHHVHVRVTSDAVAELRFRDALRANRQLADRYEQHKRALAIEHPTDREAYTEGKTAFVAAVLGVTGEVHETAA